MGVLLVVSCVVLAFLCGRLQVRVTRASREVGELSSRLAGAEQQLESMDGRVSDLSDSLVQVRADVRVLSAPGVRPVAE